MVSSSHDDDTAASTKAAFVQFLPNDELAAWDEKEGLSLRRIGEQCFWRALAVLSVQDVNLETSRRSTACVGLLHHVINVANMICCVANAIFHP